jgi:hypothetical protein
VESSPDRAGSRRPVATDDTIAVITREGDTVIDGKLSALGVDGALRAVEEEISVHSRSGL